MVQLRGNFDASMARAVVETFENLAFMEPARLNGPPPPAPAEEMMAYSLLINEPLQGEIRLRMPRSLVRLTTRTIWSQQDDALQEKMLQDTLAELLNTMVGRFLAELLAEEETFQLGLPEPCICEDLGGEENACIWYFSLDEAVFQVVAIGESLLAIAAAGPPPVAPDSQAPLSF